MVGDRLLDGLKLRGDETVLNVGCGRGLFRIGAAKRPTTGKAIGVDSWQTEELRARAEITSSILALIEPDAQARSGASPIPIRPEIHPRA